MKNWGGVRTVILKKTSFYRMIRLDEKVMRQNSMDEVKKDEETDAMKTYPKEV